MKDNKHICEDCTVIKGCAWSCLDECKQLAGITLTAVSRDDGAEEEIRRPWDKIRVANRLAENYGTSALEVIAALEKGNQLQTVGFLYRATKKN